MESYYKLLDKILSTENDSVDFIWNCEDGSIVSAGNSEMFPAGVENPFRYILEQGFVCTKSESFYEIFCTKLEEGISSGISGNSLSVDIKLDKGNGNFGYYHVYTEFMKDECDKIKIIHAHIRRFTEKEEVERSIIAKFSSDKRPDLFTKRITDLIRKNESGKYAFIQFDVERFKLINATYGSEMGDELLEFFSDTLHVVCSEIPHTRITADIFMIVMPYDTREEIIDFIHMLEKKLLGYNGIEYRLIFGVAAIDNIGKSNKRYGDHASLARLSIKGNALENIAFYEEDMINKLYHEQSIEYDMQRAAENDEFVMYLQPKYSISTGEVIGAEALARWIHPEKGMIPPNDFIPIFEKNGFIIRLDEIIWEKACRKIREWLDLGIKPVPISVNISREYLNDMKIVDILISLVEKYNIPIELLELEITESFDSTGITEVIEKFKNSGFTMLMDDFGSGYSSLNMLKTTPFDILKIDREFLAEFMESERGRKIISHTISMSNDIGIDIIAEGVETSDQALFLSECGCDIAQGFYYSKPIPNEEFNKLLSKNNKSQAGFL